MVTFNILVLGGPAAGKTHYAGQLLGRLRNDRQGFLRLRPGGADNLGKFEEVLSCLEEGRAAGHTPAQTWTGMKCQLESKSGDEVALEWPDYAGERLDSIVDKRELTQEWKTSISDAQAWLLLIRPSILKLHEDIISRPIGLPPLQGTSGKQHVKGAGWDEQARYVEMLQILLFTAVQSTFAPLKTPRLAIALSCWDELEEQGSPEKAFKTRLPLLYSFVQNSWAENSWTVWGLSSLGRGLEPDIRDKDYASRGPENFGYVIPPGITEQDSDLTAPVAWLLGALPDGKI